MNRIYTSFSYGKNHSKMVLQLKTIARHGFWKAEAGEHSIRVARKLRIFSSDLGITERELFAAGLLHDVGKASLQKEILYKPGDLTDEERLYVRTHALRGYYLLKGESQLVRDAARLHHDVDASGELYIQILHLVDIEDALSHKRCYKPALPVKFVQMVLAEEAKKMSAEAQQIFWTRFPQIIALNR